MSLLDNIYAVLKKVVALAHDLNRYQSEIKEIRHEQRDLALIIQRLAQEIQHSKEINERERTNMLLEVENRLLRLEQRLSGSRIENRETPEANHEFARKMKTLKGAEGANALLDEPQVRTPKTKRAKG